MERNSLDLIGPISSIGRPSTSMIRPSVPEPTGTLIAAPVDLNAVPRASPSDEPIAIVLTMPSPSCCCTSSVNPASACESLSSMINASNTFGI